MVFDYMFLVRTINLFTYSLGSLYLLLNYAKQRSEKKATVIVFSLAILVGLIAPLRNFPRSDWLLTIILSTLLCPFTLSFLYPKLYLQKVRFLDFCLYVSFFWWILLLYIDWSRPSLYWLLLFPTLGIILLFLPQVRKKVWVKVFAYIGNVLVMIGISFYSYFYLTEKYRFPLDQLLARQASLIDVFFVGILTMRIALLVTNLIQFLPIWGGKSHPITKEEFRRVKKYALFASGAFDIATPEAIEWVFFGGTFLVIAGLMVWHPAIPLALTLLVFHETIGERLSHAPTILKNLQRRRTGKSQPI